MAKRLLLPRSQAVGLDGRPLAGAKLLTYITGTSTPKPVFTDAALTVAHANPVVADSAGRFPAMFIGAGDYRTVLTDAADVVIATDDPVEGDAAVAAADIANAALAASRNRIVNPLMRVSQERGAALVDVTTGTATYAIDQWQVALSSTPGGTLRAQQIASVTPAGSLNRLRLTAQVADASIAAGDLYAIQHPIEGLQVADARFGTASARQLLVRFGLRSSIAGTFCVSVRNNAANRSYVTLVTVAAGEVNTDLLRTLTIPGDTAGTWLTDTGLGFLFTICLASGSTFQGTAGAWQGSNIIATAGQTNFMGTASATFELFDVGLYVDPLGLGVFPPFAIPDIADDVRGCRRFYEVGLFNNVGSANAAGHGVGYQQPFMEEKRVIPVVNTAGSSTVNVTGQTIDNINVLSFRPFASAGAAGGYLWTGSYFANARL